MRARAALAVAALLQTALLPGGSSAGERGAQTITYRARDTSRVDALEPTSKAAHASQTVRRSITDLVLRLRSWDGQPLSAALSSDSGGRRSLDRPIFAAELIIAAAGRIHVEDNAACGPWQGDVALCRTECDGGAFALVRGKTADEHSLKLHVGKVPAIQEAGFGENVRLGACSDSETAGGLTPRGGAAEIHLDPR